MGTAWRYWQLVRIDSTGKRKVEEVESAKTFFKQQFSELTGQTDVPDATIQRRLLHLLRDRSEASCSNTTSHTLAERCLRCFISSQVEQVCIQLEAQFGSEHGFTRYDLFPFILDEVSFTRLQDSNRRNQSSYKSFAAEILQTFEPERSSLTTWTARLVKHHRELNAFLLERGVYMVSDWAILNDTTRNQLQRIFAEFHQLTPIETQRAALLLESYHAVYRRERLQHRQAGSRGKCLPPTTDQLKQIAQLLCQEANLMSSPEATLAQLQETAERLRQYRIYARGGALATESLDQSEIQLEAERHQSSVSTNESDNQDEQTEFLRFYRQQFIDCLDQAIEQVTHARFNHLQSKDPQKAQKFITALQLFHCQGRSMSEIAPLVEMKAQFDVSRLLKLRTFRADVRQQMLNKLQSLILEEAEAYSNPEQIQNLEQQVEVALDEQVTNVISEAEREASIARNRSLNSLFTQRLCRYLDARRNSL